MLFQCGIMLVFGLGSFFSQEIMNSQTFFLLIKTGFVKKRKIKACVSV